MTRFPKLMIAFLLLSSAAFSQTDTSLLQPGQFEKAISANNSQLVDVRTPAEYKNGHIKNSFLADWKKRDEFESQIKKLDPQKPVYLYCAAGVRSHAAALFLRGKGFTQVYELEGGFDGWKEAKKGVEE